MMSTEADDVNGVYRALENDGIIDKIRGELRAHVLKIVMKESSEVVKGSKSAATLELLRSEHGGLIISCVRDMLQVCGFDSTLSVFDTELASSCGDASARSVPNRSELVSSLHMTALPGDRSVVDQLVTSYIETPPSAQQVAPQPAVEDQSVAVSINKPMFFGKSSLKSHSQPQPAVTVTAAPLSPSRTSPRKIIGVNGGAGAPLSSNVSSGASSPVRTAAPTGSGLASPERVATGSAPHSQTHSLHSSPAVSPAAKYEDKYPRSPKTKLGVTSPGSGTGGGSPALSPGLPSSAAPAPAPESGGSGLGVFGGFSRTTLPPVGSTVAVSAADGDDDDEVEEIEELEESLEEELDDDELDQSREQAQHDEQERKLSAHSSPAMSPAKPSGSGVADYSANSSSFSVGSPEQSPNKPAVAVSAAANAGFGGSPKYGGLDDDDDDDVEEDLEFGGDDEDEEESLGAGAGSSGGMLGGGGLFSKTAASAPPRTQNFDGGDDDEDDYNFEATSGLDGSGRGAAGDDAEASSQGEESEEKPSVAKTRKVAVASKRSSFGDAEEGEEEDEYEFGDSKGDDSTGAGGAIAVKRAGGGSVVTSRSTRGWNIGASSSPTPASDDNDGGAGDRGKDEEIMDFEDAEDDFTAPVPSKNRTGGSSWGADKSQDRAGGDEDEYDFGALSRDNKTGSARVGSVRSNSLFASSKGSDSSSRSPKQKVVPATVDFEVEEDEECVIEEELERSELSVASSTDSPAKKSPAKGSATAGSLFAKRSLPPVGASRPAMPSDALEMSESFAQSTGTAGQSQSQSFSNTSGMRSGRLGGGTEARAGQLSTSYSGHEDEEEEEDELEIGGTHGEFDDADGADESGSGGAWGLNTSRRSDNQEEDQRRSAALAAEEEARASAKAKAESETAARAKEEAAEEESLQESLEESLEQGEDDDDAYGDDYEDFEEPEKEEEEAQTMGSMERKPSGTSLPPLTSASAAAVGVVTQSNPEEDDEVEEEYEDDLEELEDEEENTGGGGSAEAKKKEDDRLAEVERLLQEAEAADKEGELRNLRLQQEKAAASQKPASSAFAGDDGDDYEDDIEEEIDEEIEESNSVASDEEDRAALDRTGLGGQDSDGDEFSVGGADEDEDDDFNGFLGKAGGGGGGFYDSKKKGDEVPKQVDASGNRILTARTSNSSNRQQRPSSYRSSATTLGGSQNSFLESEEELEVGGGADDTNNSISISGSHVLDTGGHDYIAPARGGVRKTGW